MWRHQFTKELLYVITLLTLWVTIYEDGQVNILFQDRWKIIMANMLQNEYHPESVSPPGETLLETLDAFGMSQAELARCMNRPVKTINEIIQGKTAITAETVLQLEQVLNIPASFWLKREQHYRESLARLAEEGLLPFDHCNDLKRRLEWNREEE